MKAITIHETSPHRALRWGEAQSPAPKPGDLLVAVRAAGLNRADLRRAVSHFAATEKSTAVAAAGLEFAGEVIAVGAEVQGFAVGDRVMAMSSGAFAEQVVVDYRFAAHVPPSMDWTAAASIPVSFITAHNALVTAGGFTAGETVLVQAASSAAGIAAVQIAKVLGASKIFGTAGNAEKLARLRTLGCDVAINYRSDDVAAMVKEATGGAGVQVIVDLAGGNTLSRSMDAAAVHARLVLAGRVAGAESTISVDEFSRKQLRMVGVTNRTRTIEERWRVAAQFKHDLMPALQSGALVPVVDKVFPMQDAESAYAYMESNVHFGKIVLAT
ncbi:zinc-binding dehydrogenase [Variovorax sp. KK3]|uniref:zinc-binding dehydrogenase n=1 Tax=Variovorax sp. KK3 TaxID=1855728 RepID=UPI00097C10AD|nr:zinc-binding dehydrogenase [Variovorax sp. KK3]